MGHAGHNPDVTTVFTGPKSQPLLAEGLVLFGLGRLLSYPTGGSPNLFRAGPNRVSFARSWLSQPFRPSTEHRDIGYALTADFCEVANSVDTVPSQHSAQSLLSLCRTPAPSCEGVGFFGSGGAARSPRPTDCPVYFRLTSHDQPFRPSIGARLYP